MNNKPAVQTKPTHTPGPWGYSRGLDGYPVVDTNVVGGPPLHIAKVGNFVMEASENEANARLIAAAPELLEALKMAEDAMEAALFSVNAAVNSKAVTFASYDNPAVNLKYQINSVRAAIAKAENGAA